MVVQREGAKQVTLRLRTQLAELLASHIGNMMGNPPILGTEGISCSHSISRPQEAFQPRVLVCVLGVRESLERVWSVSFVHGQPVVLVAFVNSHVY